MKKNLSVFQFILGIFFIVNIGLFFLLYINIFKINFAQDLYGKKADEINTKVVYKINVTEVAYSSSLFSNYNTKYGPYLIEGKISYIYTIHLNEEENIKMAIYSPSVMNKLDKTSNGGGLNVLVHGHLIKHNGINEDFPSSNGGYSNVNNEYIFVENNVLVDSIKLSASEFSILLSYFLYFDVISYHINKPKKFSSNDLLINQTYSNEEYEMEIELNRLNEELNCYEKMNMQLNTQKYFCLFFIILSIFLIILINQWVSIVLGLNLLIWGIFGIVRYLINKGKKCSKILFDKFHFETIYLKIENTKKEINEKIISINNIKK